MKELTENIDRIHTTELGALRIEKNIGMRIDDFASWCGRKIADADKIIRKGKNWYIYSGGIIITVNAHSYTIITAHKEV